MRVIDIFSGCGGMSRGFLNAGYDVVAAFDNWDPAIDVYRKNFQHPIVKFDLGSFDAASDSELFRGLNPDMIVGGPPCQDFSSAGKRDETLGRADLTGSFAEIVALVKPKWFVMENVDRALKSKAYSKARRKLNDAGYGLTESVLDASLCGVPQFRKRLFLIGELGGPKSGVMGYLRRNLRAVPLTVREYLGARLGVEYYYRHPRSYHRRGIFSVDEPSPTVRGVNRPLPAGYPGHRGDKTRTRQGVRPLTTIERSWIQTFPEDFTFKGNKSDLEQMIGNAVPVKLAEYVARCIAEYIEKGPIEEFLLSQSIFEFSNENFA